MLSCPAPNSPHRKMIFRSHLTCLTSTTNICWNRGLYRGSRSTNPAISVRHSSADVRNAVSGKNFVNSALQKKNTVEHQSWSEKRCVLNNLPHVLCPVVVERTVVWFIMPRGDSLYKLALKDVPERYPRKEPLQCLKGAVQERRPLAAIENVLTQLVDLCKLL